jgi:hypothetical protein
MRRKSVGTNNKKYRNKEKINLEVNGELWHRVSNLNDSTSTDKHYVVKIGYDGTAVIIYGDGKHGARLPTGKNIKVTFYLNENYSGVRLQQGRVQLDEDWNENIISAGRFCGIYRGIVIDDADPKSHMRLLVQVPEVLGTQVGWALPCQPIGLSVVPAIGEGVWIIFESGDPSRPVWMGTWYCTE